MEFELHDGADQIVAHPHSGRAGPDEETIRQVADWLAVAQPGLDRPLDRAVQILTWSGGLWGLLKTPSSIVARRWELPEEVVQAARLAARLGVRAVLTPPRLPRILKSRDVYERFAALGLQAREVFWVVGLSGRSQVLVEERIAEGSDNRCLLEPREIFRPLVSIGAARAVFVHNHPSGDPEPSRDDLSLTRRLENAGALLGIRILDHVIVGRGCYHSLLESGFFNNRGG